MAESAIAALHLRIPYQFRYNWYKDNNNFPFSPKNFSLKISKRSDFRERKQCLKFKPHVSSIAANFIASTDQVLLTISIFFAYMAGIIPRTGTGTRKNNNININNNNNNIINNNNNGNILMKDLNSTGSGVYGSYNEQKTQNYWEQMRTKLSEALEEKDNNSNLNLSGTKLQKSNKIHPLSLFALDVGPRIHLLAVTLQLLQNEVNNISQSYESIIRDKWIIVSNNLLKNLIQPIFLKWIQEELSIQNGPSNLKIVDVINKKIKDDERIFKRLNSSGKFELYSDLLFYLRFGSLRSDSYYDANMMRENGNKILEDMIIFLSDLISSIYLELISIDGDYIYSSERNNNNSGLVLCSLSTRDLQRLRNEVALNWWITQYFESVVSMYEDRYELYIINEKLEDQNAKLTENLNWWRGIFKKSTACVEKYIQISPYSLCVKRTMELRALNGWRYYFSLFLELYDISVPFLKGGINNISNAISYFLTYIIGRSLGLIFSGIRQALGWR